MHQIGLGLVDHKVGVRGIVILRGQEFREAGAVLVVHRGLPEAVGVLRVGRRGEVFAVGELVMQDGGARAGVDQAGRAVLRDGDHRAGGTRGEQAFLNQQCAQPLLLRVQPDLLVGGEAEEAGEFGGAVVVSVIEGFRRFAARAAGSLGWIAGALIRAMVKRINKASYDVVSAFLPIGAEAQLAAALADAGLVVQGGH